MSMLVCLSHSPIIMICAKPPPAAAAIEAGLVQCRSAIERFEPEQIVMFGCDHYAGFHLSAMPGFCVGLEAFAIDDVGGHPGRLDVPRAAANELIECLRDEGFDPAVSHRMRVDHGFSQPLFRLFGRNDRYPIIPIFINSMAPPLARFARSRSLGAAIGRAASRSGKRTLFLASGGMSHHPTRYYPLLGTASPEVLAWQMSGAQGGSFTDEQWFRRLREMHEEGAEMLASGKRTAADIHLNPAFDQRFIDALKAGASDSFDAFTPERVMEQAGVGALELHTWIAANAAHLAAGGTPPTESLYAPTLEYGIGYGMLYGC